MAQLLTARWHVLLEFGTMLHNPGILRTTLFGQVTLANMRGTPGLFAAFRYREKNLGDAQCKIISARPCGDLLA